jgi:hypothetical protein
MVRGRPDPSLTGVAGLVFFGAFLRQLGVDRELRRRFGHLKSGRSVVYPMGAQLRLLIDANVVGEQRVFGLESLASDRLFVHLAGGSVPSIDVVYDDLERFGEAEIAELEKMVGEHGAAAPRLRGREVEHLKVDTTVEVLFGSQEGAHEGPNPRYHGRPSYHPVIAYVAETGTVIGALLRPGDTGFGAAEAPVLRQWIRRLRQAVGPNCLIYVEIDAAGDCTEILQAIDAEHAFYLVKAKISPDLAAAIHRAKGWKSFDWDADERPTQQAVNVGFSRQVWTGADLSVRVVAVRSRERDNGKQVYLWDELDWTVQAYLTNDRTATGEEVMCGYNERAGVEPAIGEFKRDWGIGKVPSQSFDANHAAFLLKLLAFNLLRRYLLAIAPQLASWRTAWVRAALVCRPGRLTRQSGRRWNLRLSPEGALGELPLPYL